MNLTEIKERCERATPEEWIVSDVGVISQRYTPNNIFIGTVINSDADFIAHARTDVPELVAEVEILVADNEHKDTIIAQQAAEIERLTKEQDAAINDLRQACETCIHRHTKKCPWTNETVASTGQKVGVCNAWQWRGVQENRKVD